MSDDAAFQPARNMLARGGWAEALAAARSLPRSAEAAHLAAQALYELGRFPEAFEQIKQAISQSPRQPEYYLLLGHLFRESGHPEEAAESYQAGLELQPNFVTALIALGNLARDQRQTRNARQHYEQALQLRPGDPNIQTNLATVLADVGRTREAIALLESALRTHPGAATAHSNLLLTLHYDPTVTPERLAAEHRRWAQVQAGNVPRIAAWAKPPASRPLRLGFMSADFKTHPVGRLAEVLWQHLDRTQFEVYAYDAGTRPDTLTARLKTLATQWRALAGLGDPAAAELIAADQVDVLMDLSGHSAGNRLLVLARKPAPVQATWFAYPNTTGLDAVDYRMTDALADPEGEQDHRYTERLLRLPRMAWVYRPPEDDLLVQPRPHTLGQTFTFGCLNNPAKASEASLDAWAKILVSAPQARLLLLARDDTDSLLILQRRLIAAGARREQVQFVFSCPPRAFYELHHHVDLMLDPFPYNGAVTTADALWMGVPVLSLVGQTYHSRQGFAVLHTLRLDDWLSNSVEEYIQKAVMAAANPSRLATLSGELRDRLARSPIMDYTGFAREFGETMRMVSRRS